MARRERVEAMDSPEAWLYRVALNVMKRRLRRRAVEQRLFRRSHGESAASATTGNPEVWDAVRGLPDRQRLAVVLRYIADLTEADIALVMGVTRGTVASSLATARARLNGLLLDFDPTPEPTEEAPHG